MSKNLAIEQLINQYRDCWRRSISTPSGSSWGSIFEDNDFGCENLQIFRNGHNIEDFTRDELIHLAPLLTRSLGGQINRDHKMYWSWCAFILRSIGVFDDRDWLGALTTLVNVALVGIRTLRGPAGSEFERRSHRYVNGHLRNVRMEKWLIAGPLAFAVLEGMLRRHCSQFLTTEGVVVQSFSIADGSTVRQYPAGTRMNRINVGFRLLEQHVVQPGSILAAALADFKHELLALCQSGTDAYDLIDSWRNNLLHGEKYWQSVVPVLLNAICMVALSALDAQKYTTELPGLRRSAARHAEDLQQGYVVPWYVYPPDLTRDAEVFLD